MMKLLTSKLSFLSFNFLAKQSKMIVFFIVMSMCINGFLPRSMTAFECSGVMTSAKLVYKIIGNFFYYSKESVAALSNRIAQEAVKALLMTDNSHKLQGAKDNTEESNTSSDKVVFSLNKLFLKKTQEIKFLNFYDGNIIKANNAFNELATQMKGGVFDKTPGGIRLFLIMLIMLVLIRRGISKSDEDEIINNKYENIKEKARLY